MKETGIIVTSISLALLFIGLIATKRFLYKPGKNNHISGTFPIVIRFPFVWKIAFIITFMILTVSLIMGWLMEWWGVEGLSLLVIIVPVLIGMSWAFSWKLEVFEDKMIFRNILWRKKIINYEAITVVNRGMGVRAYKNKKFIFEVTMWHENYEVGYDFISTKVKIKPFIRKKYMK